VMVSKQMQGEPRFQVVWGRKPVDAVEIDPDTLGSPPGMLAELPPGTYNVQAVLNVYETFHRGKLQDSPGGAIPPIGHLQLVQPPLTY